MRGDCGTENVYVAGIQRFLRRDSQDDFAGFKSFMYGTSVANQVCTFILFFNVLKICFQIYTCSDSKFNIMLMTVLLLFY